MLLSHTEQHSGNSRIPQFGLWLTFQPPVAANSETPTAEPPCELDSLTHSKLYRDSVPGPQAPLLRSHPEEQLVSLTLRRPS